MTNISSLSPVSQADVALDTRLRADMGAPDVRYLVVVSGASQESVLQSSERVSTVLQTQVEQGELAGFESPSRYLPSAATQRARQASLPPPDCWKHAWRKPFRACRCAHNCLRRFWPTLAAARTQPLLQAADLEQTSMAMAVDALLIQQQAAMACLIAADRARGGRHQRGSYSRRVGRNGLPDVLFVDMKAESDRLYSGYLHEAIVLSLGGLVAIIGLLLRFSARPCA